VTMYSAEPKFQSWDDVVEDAIEPVIRTISNRAAASKAKGALLGRLLLKAAALYEAMDGYTDTNIVKKILDSPTPPTFTANFRPVQS
jgi:hypothetical protein